MTGTGPIAGKTLRVDLTRQSITIDDSKALADRFLGGLGVGTYYALRDTPKDSAPCDQEAVLAFTAGALVGTLAPGASRLSVNGLNPFSGGYGSASAGGFFTPELKYAGYDAVIVSGKARNPAYLLIDDDHVSIEDASGLWGQQTGSTLDSLRSRHSDSRLEVACIGPAGEQRVKAAGIIVSRNRAAARCGLGAVMGSKNLKAIAVRGTGQIGVADPEGFLEACLEYSRLAARSQVSRKLRRYGTPISFQRWNDEGALPVRNFSRTSMAPEKAVRLSGEEFAASHAKRVFGCFACPTPCSQYAEVRSGPYAGVGSEKIEGENVWDFGAKFDSDSLPSVIKASQVCNEFGLDTSSTAAVIAWAFECFERGLIDQRDTGGLELRWGDHATLMFLVERFARQEDAFARLLALGSREAAARIGRGTERFAMHVKGHELAEELRTMVGWALGAAVAERAGTHTQGSPLTERMDISAARSRELFGIENAAEPSGYRGKAQLTVYYQRFHAVMEGLGVCFFPSNWMSPDNLGPEHYLTLYNLATGRKLSMLEFMEIGERIHTLQKLVNVKHTRHGRENDVPPARFFDEPASGGKHAGARLDRAQWTGLLDEYYAIHGWDAQSTRPGTDRLASLGLGEFSSLVA